MKQKVIVLHVSRYSLNGDNGQTVSGTKVKYIQNDPMHLLNEDNRMGAEVLDITGTYELFDKFRAAGFFKNFAPQYEFVYQATSITKRSGATAPGLKLVDAVPLQTKAAA